MCSFGRLPQLPRACAQTAVQPFSLAMQLLYRRGGALTSSKSNRVQLWQAPKAAAKLCAGPVITMQLLWGRGGADRIKERPCAALADPRNHLDCKHARLPAGLLLIA